MMKRTNQKSTGKKSTGKKTNYINLSDVEDAVEIKDGEMWLKSGKYDSPSVSVKISDDDDDDDDMLSDWMRKITLRNVVLTVEENAKGYQELVISGAEDGGDEGDLPI